MRIIKKIGIIFLIALFLLIGLLLLIPVFFEDEIIDWVKTEINQNLKAETDFASAKLSLFRDFPNVNIRINDFRIDISDGWEKHQLANIGLMELELALKSLWNKKVRINHFHLDRAIIDARVNKEGDANWDIMLDSKEEKSSSSTTSFEVLKTSIQNAKLYYVDQESGMNSTLENLNLSLSNINNQGKIISGVAKVDTFDFAMDGIKYLSHASAALMIDLQQELGTPKFRLLENQLNLNEMIFMFDGDVSFRDSIVDVDLLFSSPKATYKKFLSLFPPVYTNQYENIEAGGTILCEGRIEGKYSDYSQPEYEINIVSQNGWFQYPDLPGKAENIEFDLEVNVYNKLIDNIVYQLKGFQMDFDKDPLYLDLMLRNTDTDPFMDIFLKADVNLDKLRTFMPIENGEYHGNVKADIKLKGKLSTIKNEEYDHFKAIGAIEFRDLKLDLPNFSQSIIIPNADISVSPEFVDLRSFSLNFGKSDLSGKGKLDNLLFYLLKDEALIGNLEIKSDLLDLDQLMLEQDNNESANSSPDSTIVFKVPEKLKLSIDADIKKLMFNQMEIDKMKGKVHLNEGRMLIPHLRMELLEGQLYMTGSYDTHEKTDPLVDLHIDLADFDFGQTFSGFSSVQALAPIAERFRGKFSSEIDFVGALSNGYKLTLPSLNGLARFKTKQLKIEQSDLFQKIGDNIQSKLFDEPTLSKVDAYVKIENGNLIVKPFKTKIDQSLLEVQGSQGIDGKIKYSLDFEVPSKSFGNKAGKVADHLFQQAAKYGTELKIPETIKFTASISGELKKPIVKIDVQKQLKETTDILVDIIDQKIDSSKIKAIREAELQAEKLLLEARKQADKLIYEATKQAENIKNLANNNIDKLKEEAKRQAAELMKKAGDNPIRKLAAAEAVKIINEKTEEQSAILKNEASKRADAIIQLAQMQADKLLEEARKTGDGLIEKAKKS